VKKVILIYLTNLTPSLSEAKQRLKNFRVLPRNISKIEMVFNKARLTVTRHLSDPT